MHTTDADLTPAERPREIAAILAAVILRQRTCPECAPESPACTPKSVPEKLSESGEK